MFYNSSRPLTSLSESDFHLNYGSNSNSGLIYLGWSGSNAEDKCDCGVVNGCVNGEQCNCDVVDGVWRSDGSIVYDKCVFASFRWFGVDGKGKTVKLRTFLCQEAQNVESTSC